MYIEQACNSSMPAVVVFVSRWVKEFAYLQ